MKMNNTSINPQTRKRMAHHSRPSLTFLVLWELFVGMLVTGLIIGWILLRFFLISLEGTSVPIESIDNTRRPTDLTSLLRLEGQKRDEYITSQSIQSGIRPLSYDEMLVYIEEYNLLQKQGKVLEYENDEGLVKFLGYVSGRVSTRELSRQTTVRGVPILRSNTNLGTNYSSATTEFLEKNGINLSSSKPVYPPYLASARPASSTTTSQSLTDRQSLAKLVINRGVVSRTTTSPTASFRVVSPNIASTKTTTAVKKETVIPVDINPPTFRFQTYKGVYGEGYRIYIYFEEFIEGFDEFDITLENGKITRFSRVDAKTFYVDIVSSDKSKNMYFSVPEKSLKDEAGNENKASKILNLLP